MRKIMAFLLILSMSLCFVSSAYARNSEIMITNTKKEIEKDCIFLGDCRLVVWEENNYVYAEQYDLNENLIESSIGNRTNGEISILKDQLIYTKNEKDIVEMISTGNLNSIMAISSFELVGTIFAKNRITLEAKEMYLYEKVGSAQHTTYTLKKYNGNLATFVTGLATGLAVTATIASSLVNAIVSAGLGVITGQIINIT
ncbi:MAG: hypothetical protein ACI317_03445, partial [Floccifex porci]|uniref:hypothetical protein n=1 Tax=Floccifex porci TaxID=2606629 RepID=UPI003F011A57